MAVYGNPLYAVSFGENAYATAFFCYFIAITLFISLADFVFVYSNKVFIIDEPV